MRKKERNGFPGFQDTVFRLSDSLSTIFLNIKPKCVTVNSIYNYFFMRSLTLEYKQRKILINFKVEPTFSLFLIPWKTFGAKTSHFLPKPRSRFHERKISLSFLGITLGVLRLGFLHWFLKHRDGNMIFYQVFLLSPLQCTVTELQKLWEVA